MSQPCRQFLAVLIAAILMAAISCSGGNGSGAGNSLEPDTRTPGQYFKEQQANTMTPNGMILTDSVEEKDGKIQYKTEDGKQWRVRYSKRADGTYQYDMPEEMK